MPTGGKLTITARQQGNENVIEVQDTGVGNSKEVKSKLFASLFSTKLDREGFGLSVAKRLLKP